MKKPNKVALIIPAYNEEQRIRPTLQAYHSYFDAQCKKNGLNFEIVVALNGCSDNTYNIVDDIQGSLEQITLLNLPQAGKGYAITEGFKYALGADADLIGFVDADMATSPQEFYHLIEGIGKKDGIIASRYMKGAVVMPPRPKLKRWGSKIVYEPLVRMLLDLSYKDLQCGAKLFKRKVIKQIVDYLKVRQWAFDVELLYLCKIFKFSIKEIPTVWHDQALSKLKPFHGGMRMLSSILEIRKNHAHLRNQKNLG